MTTPAFLVRLMHYVPLSRSLMSTLGPEDAMAVEFANELRKATIEGRLRGVWFHPANELAHGHKTGVKAAIARALGMHVGVSDFVFLSSRYQETLVLEAKSKTGSLTLNQKDFRAWCEEAGIGHEVFRTVDDGLSILRRQGLLT